MKRAIVTDGTISVRTGRGETYSRLGTFKKGDKITVLDSALNRTYAKVIWQEGYAYSSKGQHISFLPGQPEAPTQNAIVTANVINVRQGRGLDFARIGQYKKGDTIIVLDDALDEEYAHVIFEVGYAYSGAGRYIRFEDETTPPTREENAIVTAANRINVRTGRAQSYTKLGEFISGEKITVLDDELNQDYAHVVFEDGEGYAYSLGGRYIRWLSDTEPELPAQPNAVVTAANRISVRTGRAQSYPKLGEFVSGEKITVIDAQLDQHYAHVIFEDGEGYAYSSKGKYIRWLSDPVPEPESPPESQPQPDPNIDPITRTLDVIESCVGGKYIFGGQGHKITESYLISRRRRYPEYFTGGRYEYLLEIARRCDASGVWTFPDDYAWDCSGLWWYSTNIAGIYGRELDTTANSLFERYCDSIRKSELRPGDIAFYRNSTGRITHMGIMGKSGVVHEAMSGYTGVVTLANVDVRRAPRIVGSGTHRKSAWNVYGRPKIFV